MRREPTLILGVLSAALGLIVTFGFDWLSAEQAALIVAAFNAGLGVINAIHVRPIAPAAFTYAVTAAAALFAGYGLHVSQETVGAVNGLVLAVLMLLTRAQVTPAGPTGPTPDPYE
ncbi:hypothetical protein [Actinoplanes rectilineatus]|uniref:hypothetical protein n=1 Tax=Actinoplanes rectilineatus TaxID=113571 RepID=UPI0005F2AA52|nr:hypothetical protein [Actinoplanes rectilineatus]